VAALTVAARGTHTGTGTMPRRPLPLMVGSGGCRRARAVPATGPPLQVQACDVAVFNIAERGAFNDTGSKSIPSEGTPPWTAKPIEQRAIAALDSHAGRAVHRSSNLAELFAGAGTSRWHWQRADFGVGGWSARCTRDRCLLMLPTPLGGGDGPGA
jgi:hypothetical protein